MLRSMLDRRAFLVQVAAMTSAPPLTANSYGTELPDMLLRYLASGLDALAREWDGKRAAITTAAQLEERNRFVRVKVREMLHVPSPPTRVVARVTGTVERTGYRIEKLLYQSQPDYWVTASLYVPTTGPGPFPAVISPCGHYELARMYPDYQRAYIDLVTNGFVVLAYDPTGQGERRQYWDPATGQSEESLRSVDEHSMSGQLLLLFGENLTGYLVRDGMSGIDYLLTRREVDPKRIGCAGHSGGGTLTMFLACADERIRCAVINEGGTMHRWPFDLGPSARLSPPDAEQNLFPAAIHGIDACDLHVAIAPRPLLATIEYYAPAFNETAAHIRARYTLLGAAAQFSTDEARAGHAWTARLRIDTVDWLSHWLRNQPGPQIEPDATPEAPATLFCTPSGSLRQANVGETIFSLIRKKGEKLPPQRPATAAEVRKLLRYRASTSPLAPRVVSSADRNGLRVEEVEILSEPGIYVPLTLFLPRRAIGAPVLLLPEQGRASVLAVLEEIALRGRVAVAADVRGIGDTRPQRGAHPPKSASPYTHLFDLENMATYMAWWMDRSLLGMRVLDVIRTLDYLQSRPEARSQTVCLVGQGAGALWALYAAALDTRISSVTAHNGLLSYRTLTEVDRYRHSGSIFVPGVLRVFDLPQLAAALAPRRVTLLAPVDAMKEPVPAESASAAYRFTLDAYRKTGAAGRFRIRPAAAGANLAEVYMESLG
jgi:cephalosporin-C deacetylase-like acetyl esterase